MKTIVYQKVLTITMLYFLDYLFLHRSLRKCSYGLFENTVIFHSSTVPVRFCKSLNLAHSGSGVNLEQFLLYGAHLHTHTWLCMEVHSSILTLNTQHMNNNGFKNLEVSMYLRAWLLRIIHFGTKAQDAQDSGTIEVSDCAFSQRSQKLLTHEVMLFHDLFMDTKVFARSAKSP